MAVGVLGPLTVDEQELAGRRDRVVLSALILERPRPVSPDRLAEVLWAGNPPASAAKVVQGCIARLRGRLGADAIVTSPVGYAVNGSVDRVDVDEFERGVARAQELAGLGQHDRACVVLDETLALWRGPPYPELAGWDRSAAEVTRLEELRLQAEELRVDALLAAGYTPQALVAAQEMVAEAPLREVRHLQLALAGYRSGRQAEALETLRRCRATLREELGIEPGRSIRDLEQAILRHDPSLLLEEGPVVVGEGSPWPGLEAYDADDAEYFSGREEEVETALAHLHEVGVLAVVGPSGIGKSSFVRAGIVPRLRQEGRRVTVLTPGATPRLPGDAPDVVVVDQLEELFSLCDDTEAADAFVEGLGAQLRTGLLVLALRADRVAALTEQPALARVVERGLYLLGTLTEDGIREAIERPAARCGLRLEPGLVDLLVRELEDQPGALPLLSHALAQTWRRREGRTLTVAGYQSGGGVRGAVAQSAEAVHAQLSSAERGALRGLMLRMVSGDADGLPVRARVPLDRVVTSDTQARLVEVMVDSRLVTCDDGMVTLAHEALVRAWPRLQEWLVEDAEDRQVLHHVSLAAHAWDSLGRPASELYRGVRLVRALEWRERTGVELSTTESAYLDASRELAEREERSAEQRVRAEVRANRRLRALAAGLAGMLVLALVTGTLALRQGQRADAAAVAADARRVGAQALLEQDVVRSLLLATAATRLDPSRDTYRNLQAALSRHPELILAHDLPSAARLSHLETLADGRVLLTDRTHRVRVLDPARLQIQEQYQAGGTQGDVWEVPTAASARAGVVAVAASPADEVPVRLLDLATAGEATVQLPVSAWPKRDTTVDSLAVSEDGRRLAAVLSFPELDGETGGRLTGAVAMVWDLLAPGRPLLRRIAVPKNFVNGVALSPDGSRVFVTNPLTAYDVRTGRPIWSQQASVWDIPVDVDRSGGLLAVVDADNPEDVALVDARTGRTVRTLRGHDDRIFDLRFSHDGTLVGAVGADGLALVWDAASGELRHRIEPGADLVTSLDFGADDRTLLTATGNRRQVQAWDLSGRRRFVRALPVSDPFEVVDGMLRVGHAGRRIASMTHTEDGTALAIIDPDTDRTRTLASLPRPWGGAGSWSPDDQHYAVGYGDGVVQTFDVATGHEAARRHVLDGFITEVAHSADGVHLVAADDTGEVVLLDASTLRPAGRRVRVPQKIYALTAAPDGHTAFVSAGGTEWRAYWDVPITDWYQVDLRSGRILQHGHLGVHNAVYSSYSPDGRRVAVSGRQGEVEVVDLASGRPVRPPVTGHDGDAYWIAYSRDGSLITSAATTGDVAIWDGHTGDLVARAALPAGQGLTSSGFRADGSLLIGTATGNVYVWDPSPQAAVSFACAAAGRDLTVAEWAEAFGGRPYVETCPG